MNERIDWAIPLLDIPSRFHETLCRRHWGSEQAAGLKHLHTRLGTIAIEQRCDDESPEDRVTSILAKKLRMAMVVRRAIVGSNFHQAETPSTSLSQPIRLGGFS